MTAKPCIALLVAALSGCAATPHRAPAPARPVAPVSEAATAAPTKLDDLAVAVRDLPNGSGDLSHRRIATALERLADAIEHLPNSQPDVASRIRDRVKQLASSDPSSMDHADLVLDVLQDGQEALAQQTAVARHGEFLLALTAAATATQQLDRERGLLEQHSTVEHVIEAMADAAFLAHDRAAPFALHDNASTGQSRDAALADARAQALALATVDWSDAHRVAAKFLSALANMVEADDASDKSVAELRFQAKRLDRTSRYGLDESTWVKEALTAALTALERHTANTPSLQDARDAVANIGEHSSFAFQRATIQDGVRATLAAFSRSADVGTQCAEKQVGQRN